MYFTNIISNIYWYRFPAYNTSPIMYFTYSNFIRTALYRLDTSDLMPPDLASLSASVCLRFLYTSFSTKKKNPKIAKYH